MDNVRSFNLHNSQKLTNLIECLKEIRDPRASHKVKHSLVNILMISMFATLGGANDFVSMEQFGIIHAQELQTTLDLSNGIPSHDTFLRVFSMIDQKELDFWISLWKEEYIRNNVPKQISIDGKKDNANGYYFVRAWDPGSKSVIARKNVQYDTNEIPVAQDILKKISVKNAVVTCDAMHAQKKNARLIVDGGGDYIFVLKKNQHQFYNDVKLYVDHIVETGVPGLDYDEYTSREKGHGRIDKRTCLSIGTIGWLNQKRVWRGLRTIGCVQSTRSLKRKTQFSRQYFISSMKDNSEVILNLFRNHWSIENHSHRNLDMWFASDRSTVRDNTAVTNLAVIKDLALFLIEKYRVGLSISAMRSKISHQLNTLEKML